VVATLLSIYRDPEEVDLVIGLYAEKPPKGFAFSDTAFRVFILMASRRLKSDRFFTYDYRPEVYTKEGLRWIADNTFGTVLQRHYPGLAGSLRGVRNAFTPWVTAPSQQP
jgi:Animal haem peroxidase